MKPHSSNAPHSSKPFHQGNSERHKEVAERIRSAFLAQNPSHRFDPAEPKLLNAGQILTKESVFRENQLSKLASIQHGTGVTIGAFGAILAIENKILPHFKKGKESLHQHAKVGVPVYCPDTHALIDHAQLNMSWVLKDKEWEAGEIIRLEDRDVMGPTGPRPRRLWATPQLCYLPGDLNPFDYAGLAMPLRLNARFNDAAEKNGLSLRDVCTFLSAVLNHLNPEDRALFLAVVGQDGRWKKFLTYPGSLKNHHNYENGLFVHTAEVVANLLLDAVCQDDPVDVSLAVLAGLLHDLGKVQDYIRLSEGVYISNQNCRFIGHEQTILKWIATACGSDVSYPEERQIELEHAVCAAKRQHNQAGIHKRKTIESFLLHDADCQSARADRLQMTSILIEAGFASAKVISKVKS